MKSLLVEIYGPEKGAEAWSGIESLIADFRAALHTDEEKSAEFAPEQKSAALITYADIITEQDVPPLKTLRRFLEERVGDAIEIVHLLPFYPYTSDDGFSVSDYRAVDSSNGSWRDVERLSDDYKLCFDLVFNHSSVGHEWFKSFLRDENDYYIEVGGNEDLSRVVRPRTLPLITEFKTENGLVKKVWTTFSADQADLNFKSVDLLLEMVDIFLFYIERGASIFRLDAIAFLWKESGTTCLHLKKTHLIVKLFRAILDEVAPGAAVLTETNVPHEDNISYFGDGDEADMVYQFPLAPLTAHAILRGDCSALKGWIFGLGRENRGTFFNFLASHDGIGVNPARGFIVESEIAFMVEKTLERGGKIGSKTASDGSSQPYELNINYLSLLNDGDWDIAIHKFLMAHSLMMSLPGIPAIYFHSLIGSENYAEGVKQTGMPRSVNREKVFFARIAAELDDPASVRHIIFNALIEMLRIRGRYAAFHPHSSFSVVETDSAILAVKRGEGDDAVVAAHNFSERSVELELASLFPKHHSTVELITGEHFPDSTAIIKPWSHLWLHS